MCAVEAALARAGARIGAVPSNEAESIALAAHELRLDRSQIATASRSTGNPVPYLVSQIVLSVPASARPYVHLGATSQDIVDTAMVMTVRAGVGAILERLAACVDAAVSLAERERDTVCVARTLGKHALPTTFGFRSAGWADALFAASTRLRDASEALPVQLGGAVGTLAAYGSEGFGVREAIAEELSLPGGDRPLPWHADRSPWLELVAALGRTSTALGKVALDLRLLAGDDVGEVSFASGGRGGSSAMPHKQNPIDAILVNANFIRVPGLVATMFTAAVGEHERATGAWHAEWETIRELVRLTGGASTRCVELLQSTVANKERMRVNLDRSGGTVMAESVSSHLGRALGRERAHQLVAEVVKACTDAGIPLREALLADTRITSVLSVQEIDAALDPSGWLGTAGASVDAVIRRIRQQ